MYLVHPYTRIYIYLYIYIYICNYVDINDPWSLCVYSYIYIAQFSRNYNADSVRGPIIYSRLKSLFVVWLRP